MFKCKSSSPYQILIMKIKLCNKIIVNKTNTSANADFFYNNTTVVLQELLVLRILLYITL